MAPTLFDRGNDLRVRVGLTRSHALQLGITKAILGKVNFEIIHAYGDSHARVFAKIKNLDLLSRTLLTSCVIDGATALGMANPNSNTNAMPIFKHNLSKTSKGSNILFHLGEVDCGFLVWVRAKNNSSVALEMDKSLNSYTKFMENYLDTMRVHVSSVPFPSIRDYSSWGGLDNARREVSATIEERTGLTREYNNRLRDWANKVGAVFVDTEPLLIDETTGLLKDDFINLDPFDHHYDPEIYANIIVKALNQLGFR